MSTETGDPSDANQLKNVNTGSTDPDLFDYLQAHWKLWLLVGCLFGGLGATHALTSKRQYRADVTLAYVEDRQSMSGLAGIASQFGGIASLAGINLGDPGSAKYEALGILQSRQLTADFISKRALMQKLFSGQWNEKTNAWRPGILSSRAPTLSDAIKVFDRQIRKVNVDPKSGLISVSIVWGDRQEAAEWANSLVADANNRLRERAIHESEGRMSYLRKEIAESGLIEVHESLNRLIEGEIKSVSIARTREDYAFRVVDPARVPEPHEYVSPQPVAEVVMWTVAGSGVAIVYLVFRLRRQRKIGRATSAAR